MLRRVSHNLCSFAKYSDKKVKNMGKSRKGIPDRWSDYRPIGLVIGGTRIVAFKVPLKTNLCQQHLPEDEWFTPAILLEKQPKLKTVIDLTNTFRYYNGPEEFGTKGIDHVKILVEGRGTIPTVSQLQKFFDAMDHHMEKYKDNTDALIGVHCTHGLNRTGYFICRWMLERMDIRPDDAIERFNVARGHTIERQHLLNDLKRDNLPFVPRTIPSLPRLSERSEYRSPLDDLSYDEPSRHGRYGPYRGRESDRRSNDHYGNSVRIYGHRNEDRTPGNPYKWTKRGNSHGDGGRRPVGKERDPYSNRGPIDGSRSSRDIGDRSEHNINARQTFVRRSGGGGPSRADLDTNWRARGPEEREGDARDKRKVEGRGNLERKKTRNDH